MSCRLRIENRPAVARKAGPAPDPREVSPRGDVTATRVPESPVARPVAARP
jgi:hypothetical protein